MTLIGVETIVDRSLYQRNKKSRRIQTIKIKRNQSSVRPEFVGKDGDDKPQKTKLLINPANYHIQEGDQLYVICSENETAMTIKEFQSEYSDFFLKYLINKNKISQKNQTSENTKTEIIQDMF